MPITARPTRRVTTDNAHIIASNLEEFVAARCFDIMEYTLEELIADTPEDTGYAKQAWYPKAQNSNLPLEASNFGRRSRRRRRSLAELVAGATEGQQRRDAAINRLTLPGGFNPNTQNLIILNDAPHVVFLNQGSSSQAPAGFVQQAVEKALRNARV